MKDSPHNYKMSDIRKCFSTVGDTTLSKWLEKGFIPHQSDKKGIRTNIRYSALEIVHVGILAQLSTWGVLTYYKEAQVFGGYISLEPYFIAPEELGKLLTSSGYHKVVPLFLTKPDKIIDYYSSYGPNLVMIVTSCQVPVVQEDRRMRRTKTVFDIKILTHAQALKWEQDRLVPSPALQKLFQMNPHIEITNKFGAEACIEFGFLKLDIDRIIWHVYDKLDIQSLLD